jgi:radical SAM superfamily enzyme YgiQ (UPF0313 family)
MTYDCIILNNSTIPLSKTRGLGAHRIASVLREKDYSCLVVDFIDQITVDQFYGIVDKAVGSNTVFVGFSTMWIQDNFMDITNHTTDGFDDTNELNFISNQIFADGRKLVSDDKLGKLFVNNFHRDVFSYIKNKNNSTKIIFGGPLSLLHAKQERYEDIDHFFVGYSETQILEFMKDPHDFPRIVQHDTRANNGACGFDFKYNKTRYTDTDYITPNEVLGIELARGCKFKCKFCSFPLVGMKEVASYIRSADQLRDELIENYERFGVTKYSIMDDTFNDDTWKLEQYWKVFRDLPFDMRFWCYLRGDLLVTKPEQVPLLKEMGISQTHFGFESFYPQTAKAVGKGMDHQRLKDMAYDVKEQWKDNNVTLQASWILGLPHETSHTFEKYTMEWLMKEDCPIDIPIVNTFQLTPKTVENSLLYRSEFDRNYEDWGYYFPELNQPGGRKWFWKKNDDTDINSFDDANDLLHSYMDDIKHICDRRYRPTIYDTALDIPAFDDFIRLSKMPQNVSRDIILNLPGNRSDMFEENITKKYVEPLMKSL